MTNDLITCIIPGNPPTATAQQKGQNRKTGAWYKPKALQSAEQKYMAYLYEARPPKPLVGPVKLYVNFFFRASNIREAGKWKTTRPDTDNMLKLLKDCCTRCGYWNDDAQVAEEFTTKRYCHKDEIACTIVNVGTLKEDE